MGDIVYNDFIEHTSKIFILQPSCKQELCEYSRQNTDMNSSINYYHIKTKYMYDVCMHAENTNN